MAKQYQKVGEASSEYFTFFSLSTKQVQIDAP